MQRMLAAGEMSRWHPDPLAAFAEAPPDRHQKDCPAPEGAFSAPEGHSCYPEVLPVPASYVQPSRKSQFHRIERKKDTRSSVT